jgi:signal transduction histidine kinase
VIVALSCHNNCLLLRIEDQESGAHANANHGANFSPKSLSERAQSLGGSIKVETRPGGAAVTIQVPFDLNVV